MDAASVKLCSSKKYRWCLQCGVLVDKIDGCDHMRCRCGFECVIHTTDSAGQPWRDSLAVERGREDRMLTPSR